jgi:hypothetical protein
MMTRRHFFERTSAGLGMAALASLFEQDLRAEGGMAGLPHFPPKAKRVIYLFQSGAPSQMELFDYKPKLKDLRATEHSSANPKSIGRGPADWPRPGPKPRCASQGSAAASAMITTNAKRPEVRTI